jgi:hypothetical protein
MRRGSPPVDRRFAVCERERILKLVHVAVGRDAARPTRLARERNRLGDATIHERRPERVRAGFLDSGRVVHERLSGPGAPGARRGFAMCCRLPRHTTASCLSPPSSRRPRLLTLLPRQMFLKFKHQICVILGHRSDSLPSRPCSSSPTTSLSWLLVCESARLGSSRTKS